MLQGLVLVIHTNLFLSCCAQQSRFRRLHTENSTRTTTSDLSYYGQFCPDHAGPRLMAI